MRKHVKKKSHPALCYQTNTLLQNEAFHRKICFIHMQILIHLRVNIKLISIWKVSHKDSL